mmetsp:Transcript_134882/g.431058  ORF Transcript_134882/g.431058 Transcript_134882/m.431058 type:complete len:507 (+) Transcript_134882:80-1600(+)
MEASRCAAPPAARRPTTAWPRRRPVNALIAGLLTANAGQGAVGASELQAELLTPAWLSDDRAPGGAGGSFVRHPWAIRDRAAERALEASAEAPSPTRNIVTRDGAELVVAASRTALPEGTVAGLYVGLFSFSLIGSEALVESWMVEGNLPPAHNPLRMWTMFSYQFEGGLVRPDELGDACVGEAFRGEFCARSTSCLLVGGSPGGGGLWRLAVPAVHATNYRVEVYLGEPQEGCDTRGLDGETGYVVPWWAPPIAERVVPSRSGVARHAAFVRFRVLAATPTSWWWSQSAKVEPTDSWTEMMAAVVEHAASSPAANPTTHGFPAPEGCPRGLWLEFGVGSGKTTAALAWRMRSLMPNSGAKLHGFDSFQGLPVSWEHTKLGVGTFSTGGQIPEHLVSMPDVQIHVGLFSSTLKDLDAFGEAPVAFAHIDVDLYASAVEVLSKIACQLHAGSVLLFDELVNYAGFELSGEYRAWEYITTAYQIRWEYAGLYWQQAVPVVIMQRGAMC